MNIKPYIIILSVSFGIMIAGAVIGNALKALRIITVESIRPKTIVVLKIICLAVFSAVPLFVRACIVLQRRIGNTEFILIKWLSGHEQTVVLCFRGIFVLGLIMIFTLARDEVLSQLK